MSKKTKKSAIEPIGELFDIVETHLDEAQYNSISQNALDKLKTRFDQLTAENKVLTEKGENLCHELGRKLIEVNDLTAENERLSDEIETLKTKLALSGEPIPDYETKTTTGNPPEAIKDGE